MLKLISIKVELSKAKGFHYEHIFLHPPPLPEKNPLEMMLWSKMIKSCRKQNFLINNGSIRHKFLSKSRAQKSILEFGI